MLEYHLHLVSDATGETLNAVAKAAITQFESAQAIEHTWSLVRTKRHLDKVIAAIEQRPGVVMFTLVDDALRDQLQAGCGRLKVPCIAVLDPVIASLSEYLGVESRGQPGRQHVLDAEYFSRIEALAFTMAHDDGLLPSDLPASDIILVGVSRTSKTPTCIYLANRGYKVANIPIVPDCPVTPELFGLKGPLIVGLTTNHERLVHIRRNRLRSLNESAQTSYVDLAAVKREVNAARRMFAENDWPVIDVTRRSIEETAAEILNLHSQRQDS